MKNLFIKSCIIALSTLAISCSSSSKELDYSAILDDCVNKITEVEKLIEDKNELPRCIDEGEKEWKTVGVRDWCSGFWPGILWYAYEQTNDKALKEAAMSSNAPLKEIAYSSALDHDIGFQLYCSYGNGYRLTGNPEYKQILLDAADTLATLYNPIVGSIHSWPQKPQYPHNTIVDNMMNLELLYWAAKNGGNPDLAEIATSHAEVTMKHIVRPDYSAYHLGSFDDKDGHFIRGVAHQGYADNSMWARGQTWGIYGFAIAYRESKREDFLLTSQKMADKFLERLPEDGIPFWDFDDPKIPNTPKDASAAAVAACGMLELSKFLSPEESVKYVDAAKNMVSILSTELYYSGERNQALLLHSVGHMPKKSEIDVPIIYADYYYMEALLRLKKLASIDHVEVVAVK